MVTKKTRTSRWPTRDLADDLADDALRQLGHADDLLLALEARLRQVENKLTPGAALKLPALPDMEDARSSRAGPCLVASATRIGAIARRLHLRAGAVERALEHAPPFTVEPPTPSRAPRRLGALSQAPKGRA